LKVEVRYRDREGKEKHGSFSQDFDASGFGPGCNPEAVPRFIPQVIAKPVTPAKPAGGSDNPDKPNKADKTDTSNPAGPAEDDSSVAPPPDKPGYSH
jgi:hypothetical protein